MLDPKICHPWQLFGMQEKSDFARFFSLSRAQTSCLRIISKIHIYDARPKNLPSVAAFWDARKIGLCPIFLAEQSANFLFANYFENSYL